jgi:hypothetical protein
MGSPYLNNNETIILSTHNVIINTVPAEAILTNQRLIVIDSRHTQLRPQDIPFSAIETVTIGDNSVMEPILSLSIVMKDDTRHMLGITFTQPPKTRRTGERDEWAVKLKEAGVAAQQEHGLVPAELLPPWVPGPLPEEADGGEGAGNKPVEQFQYAPLSPRQPRSDPKKSRRGVITAVLAVIIIIALAACVYFLAPQFTGTPGTVTPTVTATTVATPVPTTAVPITTVSTTTEPTMVVTATPVATTIAPTLVVTASPASDPTLSGVWIHIVYSGNYSASFGTSGRLKEIHGSGEQFFQIPAKDQIVEATVEKSDDAGSAMTVAILNDGVIAGQETTSSPHGSVEIHVDLRETATSPITTTIITVTPVNSTTANVTTTVKA